MNNSPPSKCTPAFLPHRPLADMATTAAQAPVPQAMVSPLPRSHTRMDKISEDTT